MKNDVLEQSIDPQYSQFHLDTCAFDPKYSPEHEAAQKIWDLHENEVLHLVLAHSTQREVDHPNTPTWVKTQAVSMIYTISVTLTAREQALKTALKNLLTGNATSDKHHDDANHLFEASKYGGYFVTTDQRILKKHDQIYRLATVQVLKPSEVINRLILP